MVVIKSFEDISRLSNTELGQKLKEHGVNAAISSATANTYRKKLAKFLGISKDVTLNSSNNINKTPIKVSFYFFSKEIYKNIIRIKKIL